MKVKDMKRKNQRLILIILLLGITLGYALLSATLTINGNSKIIQQSWDIHWNNVQVTNGSVSIGTDDSAAVITTGDTTEVTYEVTLSKPGDFYEFTVDAVNAGSVDAMIDTITSTYKIGDGAVTTITSNNLPSYLEYSVAYSDGTALAQYQELKANTTETYKVRVGYKKDISVNDLPSTAQSIVLSFGVEYVQADSNATSVRVSPVSFADDDWDTIKAAVKAGNTSAYTVGATKTVDMGTLGTHTLRVANNSTPAECATEGFSQTACGFVLEFADIITTHRMNPDDNGTIGTGNVGGWPASEMRTYVNTDIYNALPSGLKSSIIDTTVVSGHGSTSGETNFTSTDKLYLLSPMEVWGNNSYSQYDSARDLSRQMDYYSNLGVNDSTYSGAIKQYNSSDSWWWLRAANSNTTNNFNRVGSRGSRNSYSANTTYGVAPAFRIG